MDKYEEFKKRIGVKTYISLPKKKEALLFTGNKQSCKDAENWLGASFQQKAANSNKIYIKTLEGLITCSPGDYIIKGVNGEFYPCKNDIFLKSYVPLKEEEGL